jgi:putative membrane protein
LESGSSSPPPHENNDYKKLDNAARKPRRRRIEDAPGARKIFPRDIDHAANPSLGTMIDKYPSNRDEADILKGLVAGIAGGVLASLVMEQFQALWSKAAEVIQRSREAGDNNRKSKPARKESQPATVKAAESISKNVFGQKLPKAKKKLAGEAVHYAMGTTSGAIYGALAEVSPVTTMGDGLAFGTAVWLLADEVSVPVLGLSKPPTKIPLSTHVYAFVSHLVYGWTTEMVRRAVRKAL